MINLIIIMLVLLAFSMGGPRQARQSNVSFIIALVLIGIGLGFIYMSFENL